MITALIAVVLFTANAQARTYLPSGCSTVTECKDTKNQQGELNGPQVCVNYYKKDIVVLKATWKNDKLDKDFFCANDDGIPVVEAKYKDGELDGVYKEYDRSLKSWGTEYKYVMGKRQGIGKSLLNEGRARITNFKDDAPHGFTVILDKNQKIESLTDCHVNGQRASSEDCEKIQIPGFEKPISAYLAKQKKNQLDEDNKLVEEKYADGKIKERYTRKAGKIVGDYERFYQSGKPQIQAKYVDGLKVEEKVFYREGQLESHTFYDKAWAYKMTLYYQNGNKKYEKTEAADKKDSMVTIVDFKNYWDNGNVRDAGRRLKSPTTWGEGVEDGEILQYSKSGQIIQKALYDRGKRIGEWEISPEKGKFDYKVIYKDDVEVSESLFDKKTKKLMKKIEFFPDGSTKSEFKDPAFNEKDM